MIALLANASDITELIACVAAVRDSVTAHVAMYVADYGHVKDAHRRASSTRTGLKGKI